MSSPRVLTATTRGAAKIAHAVSGARLTVLIFHRVLDVSDPISPSTPDAVRFERDMKLLARCFHVLPLDEALARLSAGDLPARSAAITFDDGYADNFTVALPILARLGLTATFFVSTGFLDGGCMWNDAVIESVRSFDGDVLDLSALGLGAHPVSSASQRIAAIDRILTQLKYAEADRREDLSAAIAGQAKARLPRGLMMTSGQVKALAARGMSIGAHTVRHPILAKLDEGTAEHEIRRSKETLDALLGSPVTLFAYPNGKPARDYDRRHVDMVRRCGFFGAVSTAIGAAPAGADRYQIPRFTPWASSEWRYAAQLVRNLHRTRYPVAI